MTSAKIVVQTLAEDVIILKESTLSKVREAEDVISSNMDYDINIIGDLQEHIILQLVVVKVVDVSKCERTSTEV